MMPLFEPLSDALMEQHLTERLFHGDETRWKVFQDIEGKIGCRWYLWVTRSASVVYFIVLPVQALPDLELRLVSAGVNSRLWNEFFTAITIWANNHFPALNGVMGLCRGSIGSSYKLWRSRLDVCITRPIHRLES